MINIADFDALTSRDAAFNWLCDKLSYETLVRRLGTHKLKFIVPTNKLLDDLIYKYGIDGVGSKVNDYKYTIATNSWVIEVCIVTQIITMDLSPEAKRKHGYD